MSDGVSGGPFWQAEVQRTSHGRVVVPIELMAPAMTVAGATEDRPHTVAIPLDEVLDRLGEVLAGSVADAAELMWVESASGRAVAGGRDGTRRPVEPQRRHSVQVVAREGGRAGFHRTGASSVGELAAALRTAVGQSRLHAPGPAHPFAAPGDSAPVPAGLHDPRAAALTVATAGELLAGMLGDADRLVLDWSEVRLAVANTAGLATAAAATAVTLHAVHGRGDGAGRASASARSIAGLEPLRVVERARRRAAPTAHPAPPPAEPVALLLAPEASAALVRLLAVTALTHRSFADGTSFLGDQLGRKAFDAALTLVDDGTDARGLPFPFDGGGFAKRRIEMVTGGVLRTPAVGAELAGRRGLAATPHTRGLDEARPDHLFLAPGGAGDAELGRAADGGVWIGELFQPHVAEPAGRLFRATARNVRRLAAGAPADALPDLVWEADLAQVLRQVVAVGSDAVALATRAGWGATSAPSLALPPLGSLRPAP